MALLKKGPPNFVSLFANHDHVKEHTYASFRVSTCLSLCVYKTLVKGYNSYIHELIKLLPQ